MAVKPRSSPLVTQDERLPLHARIKDDMSARVRAGEWAAASPIPPESSLASDYGVSLGTVRRVLAELAGEGLIERRQGRGTFIRRANFDHALFRFFRFPGREGEVPTSRILSRQSRPAGPVVGQRLGISASSTALYLHRLRLWDDDPFLVEDIWLSLPKFAPIRDIPIEEIGDLLYPAYESLVGEIVGSATEELSVSRADAAQSSLLGCAPGEPVVRIDRVALAHSGAVIEYRVSHGVAASFRYRVEIS